MELSPEIKIWFAAFLVMVAVSALLHQRQRHGWALFTLTLGGLCLYLTAAHIYPFLNLWDEQYHALVAKNCMSHPFRPTLYEQTVVPGHDYGNWICADIWLHKQPLFLWQIALSFKLFGVSLFALRLPSVLMCTLLIPLNYRMAQLLTKRLDIAYFTALATASSWFLFYLTSGGLSTDHNDVCFLFYISASVWAFMEYVHRGRSGWGWIILVGVLAGGAMLTKWLVGLLVFLVWGCYLLAEKGLRLKEWKVGHLLAALGVTLALFLSWQLYCFHQYPVEAHRELMLNFRHANEVIEDHSGPWSFYLMVLPMQFFGYGPSYWNIHFVWNFSTILCYIILAVGLVLALRAVRSRSQRITLFVVPLFVYLFFSHAPTKMPAFTFIVSFVWFLAIGCVLQPILQGVTRLIRQRHLQLVIVTALCTAFGLYASHYPHYYRDEHAWFYQICIKNKHICEKWQKELPEKTLVFNVKSPSMSDEDITSCIAATFHSGRECYFERPSIEVLKELQRQGFTIAAVRNPWIPEAYEQDSSIVKLEMR